HASQAELVESQRITHLGSWGWNIQTNEITWSDEQFRLNGFEPGSVQPTYDLFLDIVHSEDRAAVQLALEASVKTGEPYNITMRVVHPDGNQRYLLVRGEIIHDETGAPLRMLGSSLDITERKDYESALQISDEQFSSAFENAAIGMSLVSLDGHWIKANRALCELLGYSQEELSEMTFQEITHPDDLKDDLKYVHHVLTGEVSSYHMEKRYITKAQEIVWVMLSVSLVRDTYGQPWHFISQIQDITRRKETEAALSLTAERMRLAARAGNVGLWEYDLTDGSLLWDEQMYILYGVDPETAAVGVERWAGSVHPDDRMLAELKLAESLTEETKPFDAEFRIIRANDKSVRYLRGIGTVIRDQNGNPQRMIGTNWDMTDERQHQEELARALEHERELARQAQAGELAKSEFLAVMSHEIRTPMNGILGFAELLARSPSLTGENKEYADTIMHSGEALLRILDDILDFSRLEAGRLSIEKVIFSPAQIVEDVHALLVQSAKEKGLKMILSVDPNVPEILEGDAGRLRQVLLNLSGNAIKFTERGSVTLRLAPSLDSPEYAEQGIASLDFAVIDTGPGISEEKCSTIFEPFIQADSGISRRYGGSGLGLAISHRLVELMDGEFSVKSKVGRGSEFRITVPFNLPTLDIEPEKPVIEKPLDESFSVLHPLRILVVEDDKINLRLILTFLKKLGYKPLSALNGVEAVKTFREMKPNCILMDIQMPEMDGIAATRSIRHLEKEGEGGAPAFITALTAGTMASDRHRCSDAGMNSFLTKPIKHSLLAQMLSHASHLLENGIERKDS
ncbi:MAG: PAS domain-containing protein, partial [Chthoniobacterales bacterium]